MNIDSEPFPLPLPMSNGPIKMQSNTEMNDPYTYTIDSNKQIIICYYLNQNNVWERAANMMGYSAIDVIVSFHRQQKNQFQRIYTKNYKVKFS